MIAPEKIRHALLEPSRSLAWMLVLTRLRIGELLAVRWRNVDLEHGVLRVVETVYVGHFDVPKTQRSQRSVPLGTMAIRILTARKPAVANPDALVFATRDGSPFDRHNLSRRQIKSTCKKLGLAGVSWHWLRHAHATLLDAVGTPLGTVQALLGHSSSEITREGEKMLDFKRDRRQSERNQRIVGGLPLGDPRQNNKKAYGEAEGGFVGFMDELTPCRVRISTPDRPWFRLNPQFMDVKRNRCLSGPPTHWGYCATNLELAKKFFFWYALARTFLQHSYPMWVDADDMWEPTIPEKLERTVFQTAFAIGYAENECVQTHFPANNPVQGVPELIVNNPMTPLIETFWSGTMRPYCDDNPSEIVTSLIRVVDNLFDDWRNLFKDQVEVPLSRRPYMLDDQGAQLGAGIIQVRAYAEDANDKTLVADWSAVAGLLSSAKSEFYGLVTSTSGLNYFGVKKKKKAASAARAGDDGASKALA